MILLKIPAPYWFIYSIYGLCLFAAVILFFAIRAVYKLPRIPRDAREIKYFNDFEYLETKMKTIKSEPV